MKSELLREAVIVVCETLYSVVAYTLLTLCVVWSYIADLWKLPLPASSSSSTTTTDNKEKQQILADSESVIISSNVRDYILSQTDLVHSEHKVKIDTINSKPIYAIVDHIHLKNQPIQQGFEIPRPVILQHGLLQRGGVFVASESKSLAIFLARAGLDIWISNTRCSVQNISTEQENWDYSLEDLALKDFKSVVEYVTNQCSNQKPVYVGHSQGATMPLIACNLDSTLSDKLRMFVGLCPAFFVHRPKTIAVGSILCGISQKSLSLLFGRTSFLPLMILAQKMLPSFIFASLASHMFEYLFNWRCNLWPQEYHSSFFQFTPAPVSALLMRQWIASLQTGCIVPISDLHNQLENSKSSEAEDFSVYSVPEMHCPVSIIYGLNDGLVDAEKLTQELIQKNGQNSVVYTSGIENYNHLDVLWASDAQERVFYPLLSLIEASFSDIISES